MNDFDTFWHEAKAAVRVALQWFFLAVPMGLLCGFLGTLFHLAVEHATELRAAQPWLLFLLPVAGLLITALYKVTKCEGVGTNNVLRAVQSGEPVSILLVPAIFLGTVLTHLCGGSAGRRGRCVADGRQHRLEPWHPAAAHGPRPPHRHHQRHGCVLLCPVRHPAGGGLLCHDGEDVGLTFTSAFVPAFTSALIAYGCSLVFGIAPTHFALTAPELNVRTALLVILLGVACAAVSRLFCYTLHFMEHTVPKLLPNPWVRVFAGGVLVIGFSYLFGVGRYNGAGMNVITAARGAGTGAAVGFSVQDLPHRADPCLRVQGRRGGAQLFCGRYLRLRGRPAAGSTRRICGGGGACVHLLRCHQRPDPLHPAGL